MASEMDRFFDLLQEQSRTLIAQGLTLATIAQSQKDGHERLFGQNGQPGIIQYLANEDKKLAGDVAELSKGLAGVKSDRRVDKAYIMGASAVITLGIKAGLSKLGWHF